MEKQEHNCRIATKKRIPWRKLRTNSSFICCLLEITACTNWSPKKWKILMKILTMKITVEEMTKNSLQHCFLVLKMYHAMPILWKFTSTPCYWNAQISPWKRNIAWCCNTQLRAEDRRDALCTKHSTIERSIRIDRKCRQCKFSEPPCRLGISRI